jgi:DMSO/TMAO reductase YedYZ molybdopterin-dependent catalytic subunit
MKRDDSSFLTLPRREFLRAGAGWLGAAALAGVSSPLLSSGWARILETAQGTAAPDKERMIVHSLRFLTLELPMPLLDSWITPVELFYVRNNLGQPEVNLANWRLKIIGEVERPLELTFADLEKMKPATVTDAMECSGNGRAFFRPRIGGVQWGRGGVSNGVFSGPRLADLLRHAGVKPAGKHVAFKGFDQPPGKAPDFIRSIPIEKALSPHTLVATRMNGAALTLEHGFPARVLVPGWIGAASVKWLSEIRVLEREFDGFFMNPGFRIPTRPVPPGGDVNPNETAVITSLPAKSIIARPGDGSHWKLGPIRIAGAAWAGEAKITRVDVSTDEGRTWQRATLGRDKARYAWRLWEHVWTPPQPGSYVVMSRATDAAGRGQPMEPPWNPEGYLWNAIDKVRIHVET